MYKARPSLFTGCNGPVCAQHGCEQGVIGTAMASKASRAGNIMEAKFGPKMGHFVIAVLDILGRSAGPTVLQIAGETRGW